MWSGEPGFGCLRERGKGIEKDRVREREGVVVREREKKGGLE